MLCSACPTTSFRQRVTESKESYMSLHKLTGYGVAVNAEQPCSGKLGRVWHSCDVQFT